MKLLIAIIVIASLWIGLRAYTAGHLSSYNECYLDAARETDVIKQKTLAAGYSYQETNSAAITLMDSRVEQCNKKRPPDFLIWLTGAS
jgi:hypothetical protein